MKNSETLLQKSHASSWRLACSIAVCISFLINLAGAKALGLHFPGMQTGKTGTAMTLAKKGIRSTGFRRKVGGVAFAELAQPSDKNAIISKLRYNAAALDGKRMEGFVKSEEGGKWLTIPAFDWEFVPTARFVADKEDNEACFTLFGDLTDEKWQEQLPKENYWILNYHPAFEDTLLGLRLFQADILLLYEAAADLPLRSKDTVERVPPPKGAAPNRKKANAYLLGNGEITPDVTGNKAAFRKVHLWYNTYLASGKEGYSSYVICDAEQKISYSVNKTGHIDITGNPIWLCWADSKEFSKLRKAFRFAYQKERSLFVRSFMVKNRLLSIKDEARLSNADVEMKFVEATKGDKNLIRELEVYRMTVLNSIVQKEKTNKPLTAKEWQMRMRVNQTYKLRAERRKLTDSTPEDEQTVELMELSKALTIEILKANGINPAVHEALTKTMRLSAIFRAIKSSHPKEYIEFCDTLKSVKAGPAVETPDHLKKIIP